MRPRLDRTSSELQLGATPCRVCSHRLRRAGLLPLRRLPPRPASSLGARPVGVQAAYGNQLLAAAQEQVRGLAETWEASPARAFQAALAATAAFVQRLLRQVWLAAVAMSHLAEQQAAAVAAAAAPAVSAGPAGADGALQPAAPLLRPLEAFAAATGGAVERLRHTLTDASSTLETKWTAMEATVGGAMSGLFLATSKSAEELNRLEEPSREWQQAANEVVVQHEEALYQQVFMQVYGELLSKENHQISYNAS